MIYMDESDALQLRTGSDVNGVVMISIELVDNGGTEFGGSDSSQLNCTLVVDPVNSRPVALFPPAGVTVVCTEDNSTFHIQNAIHVVESPLDERDQRVTFDILRVSDASLFATPIQISSDGSISGECNPGSSAVTSLEVVLRDDGGSRPAGFGAENRKVCTSTDSIAPSCEVIFTGLAPTPVRAHDKKYSGYIIRVSVVNTDFSDEDEYVSAVWIGNKKFTSVESTIGNLSDTGGKLQQQRFMSHGADNMCQVADDIIEMWLPADSEVFEELTEDGTAGTQQLRVRIETSAAVGCCFCYGATLYADVRIMPYVVPDYLSMRNSLGVWVLPQRRHPSIKVPDVLNAVEQSCTEAQSEIAIADFVLNRSSGIFLADEVWSINVSMLYTTNPRLFEVPPILREVAGSWTLVLALGCSQVGNADLRFSASVMVSRPNGFETQIFETPNFERCTLRVRPKPVVKRVEPRVGDVHGGTLVTVHGYHLSPLSETDVMTIKFNGRECSDVMVLSSTAATCITPASDHIWHNRRVDAQNDSAMQGGGGATDPGYVNVSVELSDVSQLDVGEAPLVLNVGDHLRRATLVNGYRYSLLLVAVAAQPTTGVLGSLSPEYLGQGPTPITTYFNFNTTNTTLYSPSSYFPSDAAKSAWDTGLRISGGITALVVWRDRVIVAGTFDHASQLSRAAAVNLIGKANRIFSWDGENVAPLAVGLDGPVFTLAAFSDHLIVGGSFVRALQSAASCASFLGPPVLESGKLTPALKPC